MWWIRAEELKMYVFVTHQVLSLLTKIYCILYISFCVGTRKCVYNIWNMNTMKTRWGWKLQEVEIKEIYASTPCGFVFMCYFIIRMFSEKTLKMNCACEWKKFVKPWYKYRCFLYVKLTFETILWESIKIFTHGTNLL